MILEYAEFMLFENHNVCWNKPISNIIWRKKKENGSYVDYIGHGLTERELDVNYSCDTWP